jgi:hypothetical protein
MKESIKHVPYLCGTLDNETNISLQGAQINRSFHPSKNFEKYVLKH